MNIITIPYGGRSHYIRPDTSCNKDCNDYFCLDSIEVLAAVPFVYAKIERAAKAVSSKFAPRYYTLIGYGVRLIAPELITPERPETWWLASSLDLSTYFSIPIELSKIDTLLETVSQFTLNQSYLPTALAFTEKINSSFEAVSKYTTLKTGDYLTIDLLPEDSLLLKKTTTDSFSLGEIQFKIIW